MARCGRLRFASSTGTAHTNVNQWRPDTFFDPRDGNNRYGPRRHDHRADHQGGGRDAPQCRWAAPPACTAPRGVRASRPDDHLPQRAVHLAVETS